MQPTQTAACKGPLWAGMEIKISDMLCWNATGKVSQ